MHLLIPPSPSVTFSVHLAPNRVVLTGRGAQGGRAGVGPGPLEAGGRALCAAMPLPWSCSVTLHSSQQTKQTSKSKNWVHGFVPAAPLQTWCVSLIWFYLALSGSYLSAAGHPVFLLAQTAAHVDSDFLHAAPMPPSSPIVKDASELLARSRRFGLVGYR